MNRRFGFIREKLEIKILILFVLRRLPEAPYINVLADLVICEDSISYFKFIECVDELVKTGHIEIDGNLHIITEKGKRNGKTTEDSLPFSVRKLVEKNISEYRVSESRSSMIETMHTANDDGSYTTVLTMSDKLGDIVKINLYTADEKQAIKLESGFRKGAERIYNEMIGIILKP